MTNRKVFNKLFLTLGLGIFTLLILTIKSNAASLSITTSKSSVDPGESFTVTVTLSNGAGYISSGGKTEWLDNSSFSYTKTAGSSGSVTVSASGTAADYKTEKDQSLSASKTVTIIKPTPKPEPEPDPEPTPTPTPDPTPVEEEVVKSSDSSLSALKVKEGAISPKFNSDKKEYAITIPYEKEEIKITATPNDSAATVNISGNKKLKEGENKVIITVTAEDGSTTDYVIKVTRKRVPLALTLLTVKCIDKDGSIVEIPLNPEFSLDVLEYRIDDLESFVNSLEIDAISNIKEAEISINGADNLQKGENTIIITVSADPEDIKDLKDGEKAEKETITYIIKANKKAEPSWIKGLIGSISSWYNNNQQGIVLSALGICIIALIGLSVYIAIDYNKYKDIIAKAKKIGELNNASVEKSTSADSSNEKTLKSDKVKGGKHF